MAENNLNSQACLYSEVPDLASSRDKTDDTPITLCSNFLANSSFFVVGKETASGKDGLNELN